MIFKMSDIDQTVTVYKLHSETNEFIGSDNAFIPAHTGLPANCTTIKPPLTKDGFVAIFKKNRNGLLLKITVAKLYLIRKTLEGS